MTEYAVNTTNAKNTITATVSDENAAVVITVNGDEVGNGTAATWESGENIVTITVTNGGSQTVYTVNVTKS